MDKDHKKAQDEYYKSQIVLIVEKEKAYLDPHFDIETFALRMGVNRFKLARIVSNLFGVSPLTYVNRLRAERAKNYLKDSRLSSVGVCDIGAMAGFSSRYTFIYEFKNIVGMTPSEYRSSLVSNNMPHA